MQEMDFSDREDFEDAHRGFMVTLCGFVLMTADNHTVYDLTKYGFLVR